MAHWRDEYLAALTARDRCEKANIALYNAYTQLADRTGRITTTPSIPESQQPASPSQTQPTPSTKKHPEQPGSSLQESLAATRADLSEAQRSRSDLQDKLDRVNGDLEKLRKKSTQDARRINNLDAQRTQLQLRLKDQDEERRGKAKLLDDVQDELATLNLQLNMAEDKSNRLQRENQELVDRWMARMGKEAEAMNDASKFS